MQFFFYYLTQFQIKKKALVYISRIFYFLILFSKVKKYYNANETGIKLCVRKILNIVILGSSKIFQSDSTVENIVKIDQSNSRAAGYPFDSNSKTTLLVHYAYHRRNLIITQNIPAMSAAFLIKGPRSSSVTMSQPRT